MEARNENNPQEKKGEQAAIPQNPMADAVSADLAVLTDLEPDDTLYLILKFTQVHEEYKKSGQYPIKLIGVGERHSLLKKHAMQVWLTQLKESGLIPPEVEIKIARGFGSKERSPHDGLEIFSSQEATEIQQTPDEPSTELEEALVHYLKSPGNHVIESAKPMKELSVFLKNSQNC